MNVISVLATISLLAVSACGMTMQDIADAGTPAGDQKDCAALGFQPGTDAMATCMNTAATNRQAELDRIQTQEELDKIK